MDPKPIHASTFGRLLFEADGDDIAERQIEEFSRWALIPKQLTFDVAPCAARPAP